jgi:2-polyprenyl-6-methoxyphenol hydroxylase-like FAD-dependent oxidoreductase
MPPGSLHHTVVIGASIAGLTAARVLADHADLVTVIDRDELFDNGRPRRRVPQGQHAHSLLASGARALESLFPGLIAELVADGAAQFEFNQGTWHQAGGYRAASLMNRKVVNSTRPFLEAHLRRRVRDLPNVRIASGVSVERLLATSGRVRGVTMLAGDDRTHVAADFVVDCSGRASHAPQWLHEIGFPAPAVLEVSCDTRYATMMLRRAPADDGLFAVVIGTPPDGKRAAYLLPVEDGRWIATLGSSFGAAAPTDEESFRSVARSLPAPEFSRVLERSAALTTVVNHRLSSNRRRRYEKLERVPAGFLAVGDAICSFNPVYAQGMSSAILEAVALGEAIATHDNDARLVRAFYRRAAKIIAAPWQLSIGADLAFPECVGRRSLRTALVNRYMAHVLLAAQASPEVNTAMILVQNLVSPPSSLFKPSMVRAVRRGAREADRRRRDAGADDLASVSRRAA